MSDAGEAGTRAFSALMARLHDEGDAGLGYETLRRRLVRFFRLQVPVEADALADIALDRLARRIADGTDVSSVAAYALGIARLVLLEAKTRQIREQRAETDPTAWPESTDDDDAEDEALAERTATALSACLDEAGADARALILEYYTADGAERIRVRQHLADKFSISPNALRNRALRMRGMLEECVRARLARSAAP